MTGSKQRTLDSALRLSLRAIERNQETLSYADQERYWNRLYDRVSESLEDAIEAKRLRLAEKRKAGA